jgi:hypothetical protein
MDDFKPSKRGTAVGGVNDGPYVPPHMQPGAQGANAFVPGGTVGIQNNQIPKTYEEISNTPLQTRTALPGQMNHVTLDQLDSHGRLKQPSPEHLTVNGGPDTAHIWKGRYVGEIVECLSGPVRTDENGVDLGTVFELGSKRGLHPSFDEEKAIRYAVQFPIAYDPSAKLHGFDKAGHFRFAASLRQQGKRPDRPTRGGRGRTPVAGVALAADTPSASGGGGRWPARTRRKTVRNVWLDARRRARHVCAWNCNRLRVPGW